MIYKNSVVIISTRKDSTVGSHMIATKNYQKLKPTQFAYKDAPVDSFEIYETVGGKVVIDTTTALQHADVTIKNEILISNVVEIRVLTEYDV